MLFGALRSCFGEVASLENVEVEATSPHDGRRLATAGSRNWNRPLQNMGLAAGCCQVFMPRMTSGSCRHMGFL